MYCVERMEYFQLTKENVDDFLNGFGKRVFRIGEPTTGTKYRIIGNGVDILDANTCDEQIVGFFPFDFFAVHNYASDQTLIISQEEFQEMFSAID